jgi:toxin-antitoxin system PIN domain toxin
VILIDANLLLYAYNSSSEHHRLAKNWLEEAMSKPEPVCLAWVTVLAFLRISTNPRAFPQALSIKEALNIVTEWLAIPTVHILAPTDRHLKILESLLPAAQALGALVMDGHLAALAIEHGAILYTTDRDFARFPGVRVLNPLDPEAAT